MSSRASFGSSCLLRVFLASLMDNLSKFYFLNLLSFPLWDLLWSSPCYWNTESECFGWGLGFSLPAACLSFHSATSLKFEKCSPPFPFNAPQRHRISTCPPTFRYLQSPAFLHLCLCFRFQFRPCRLAKRLFNFQVSTGENFCAFKFVSFQCNASWFGWCLSVLSAVWLSVRWMSACCRCSFCV